MALMDELSARLRRQDGAGFNEEVLPLLSETSTPGPLTLTLTLAQALAPTLSLTLKLNLTANPNQVLPLRRGDRRAQAVCFVDLLTLASDRRLQIAQETAAPG